MLESGVQTRQTSLKPCVLNRFCWSRSWLRWWGPCQIDTIPESHDLANKPLVEALFELRVEARQNATRGTTAFRLLFGRYYERIRASYPEAEDLPSSAVPEIMTPYVVRHRFRASKEKWPVTQLGPGHHDRQ